MAGDGFGWPLAFSSGGGETLGQRKVSAVLPC